MNCLVVQQQDQLSAMSALSAYLREAQAQQAPQPTPPQPQEPHLSDASWSAAMNERQQLAFRSLSDATVDPSYGGHRSSEMLRASLQGPTPASSSFPGDIIPAQSSPHLSNVSTAGKVLLTACGCISTA